MINRMWQEDDGVLSFEWVLLITLVCIGIVGGLAAARDAIIDELGDIAQALISFDQSYVIAAVDLNGDGDTLDPGEAQQTFIDTPAEFVDCGRGGPDGQAAADDAADGG
jgi:Flp pilus assembly pilin Flp